jgi:hypothetical protein
MRLPNIPATPLPAVVTVVVVAGAASRGASLRRGGDGPRGPRRGPPNTRERTPTVVPVADRGMTRPAAERLRSRLPPRRRIVGTGGDLGSALKDPDGAGSPRFEGDGSGGTSGDGGESAGGSTEAGTPTDTETVTETPPATAMPPVAPGDHRNDGGGHNGVGNGDGGGASGNHGRGSGETPARAAAAVRPAIRAATRGRRSTARPVTGFDRNHGGGSRATRWRLRRSGKRQTGDPAFPEVAAGAAAARAVRNDGNPAGNPLPDGRVDGRPSRLGPRRLA